MSVQSTSIVITPTIRKVVASWDLGGHVVIVPSAQHGSDPLSEEVALRLRSTGQTNSVAVESNDAMPAIVRARLARNTWQPVDLRALDPSSDLDRVTMRTNFLTADAMVIACDLDLVAERGPYVLDVMASRAPLSTKARLHARRGRIASAAELNLAVTIGGCALALTIDDDRWYVATRDPIAGELVALTLSEQSRAEAHSVVVPWEDPIVQRATELHLGVLTPAEIVVEIDGDVAGHRIAEAIAHQIRRRLGLN